MTDLSICPLIKSADGFWLRDQSEVEGVAADDYEPGSEAGAISLDHYKKTFIPRKIGE